MLPYITYKFEFYGKFAQLLVTTKNLCVNIGNIIKRENECKEVKGDFRSIWRAVNGDGVLHSAVN